MKRYLFALAAALAATCSFAGDPRDSAVVVSAARGGGVSAVGSGTVFASEGDRSLVVTNHHVVKGSGGPYTVTLGSKDYPAKLLASERTQAPDLAVLLVDARLPAAPIATELPAAGDEVRTFGFGIDGNGAMAPKVGVAVSIEPWDGSPVLKTTAPIVSGDSGAGVFNAAGELVGVAHDREVGSVNSYAAPVTVFASWTVVEVKEVERFPRLKAALGRVKGAVGLKPKAEAKLVSYASVYERVGKGETVRIAVGVDAPDCVRIDPATLPPNFPKGAYACRMVGKELKMFPVEADKAPRFPRLQPFVPGVIQYGTSCQFGNCPNGR